jgi:predicted outer membrane repeat protein
VVEALLRREGMGVSENALLARARGYLLRGAVLAALTLLMTLLYASAAWADTFTVTNLNDSGTGSLREAINDAEARAGADEIVFADGVSGTITLRSMLPSANDCVIDELVINGGGDVTVSGNDAVPVLWVCSDPLILRNLTITDGLGSPEFGFGAGSIVNFGRLKVINSTFSGNGPVVGASGDDFPSGAIQNGGFDATLDVINSTFSGNNSSESGAGINNECGTVDVSGSTFSGNSAEWNGGAIVSGICQDFFPGDLTITNSTFSGNSANLGGGALSSSGALEVNNSTFSGNSAPEGGAISASVSFGPTRFIVRNTIVANSTSGDNCSLFETGIPITDGGYNIDDDGSCGLTQATGSLPNTNPLLDPAGLSDNGGPTQTIALQPESPAVDLVGQEVCPPPNTDQRGVERPQGEACDSGAFELVQGPQTKADCKKGGWEEFGFKNQGRCIASLQKKQSTNG